MRKTRGVVSQRLMLQIEPLIVLNDGTPIYPIMGSDPEGQEGSEEEDPDEEDGEDEGDGEESEGDEKPKPKSKSKPKETDAQRIRRLNAENKQRREALEAAEERLRAIEDKDKSELEIAKRDYEELKAKYEKVPETLNALRIENAFLKLPGYNWHDPDDALDRILKDPDVTIDDDGTVDGLEQAVKDLAKKKPYLLKGEEDGEEDEGKTRRPTPRGSSGAGVGSGPRSTKKAAKAVQRTKLIDKYGLNNGR